MEIVSCWVIPGAGRLLLLTRACLCQLVEGEVPGDINANEQLSGWIENLTGGLILITNPSSEAGKPEYY